MIGEGLLSQSATRIYLCDPPVQPTEGDLAAPKPSYMQTLQKKLSLPKISNPFKHHDAVEQASTDESHPRPSSSPEPQLTQLPAPVAPRRIVILLIGIKPHRSLWTTSARPGESVIQYISVSFSQISSLNSCIFQVCSDERLSRNRHTSTYWCSSGCLGYVDPSSTVEDCPPHI